MDTSSRRIQKDLHFQGNVQGVGFRYTTTKIARNYDITGYVKNLPDGQVRLVAEGTADQVDRFLEEVRDAMASHIHSEDVDEHPASGDYHSFGVG
jgi:acylphosphatase